MTILRSNNFPKNAYASRTKLNCPLIGDRIGSLVVTGFHIGRGGAVTNVILQCDCGGAEFARPRHSIASLKNNECLSCTKVTKSPQELLHYEPDTGVFTWAVSHKYGANRVGMVAGSVNKTLGYIMIQIRPRMLYAHRLAWEFVYGAIPCGLVVDHINRNKTDNRIKNLRLATNAQNISNSRIGDDFIGDHWPFLHPVFSAPTRAGGATMCRMS